MTYTEEKQLLEKLSEIEHNQWIFWAQNILKEETISTETRERWQKYFIPYGELDNETKSKDRFFAKKSLEIFKKYLKEH